MGCVFGQDTLLSQYLSPPWKGVIVEPCGQMVFTLNLTLPIATSAGSRGAQRKEGEGGENGSSVAQKAPNHDCGQTGFTLNPTLPIATSAGSRGAQRKEGEGWGLRLMFSCSKGP